MKVKLGQAVKMFFGNSSLEMVYFEAIANSLDAKATEIHIKIFAETLSQPETLKVEISDNGEGFTDERYKKFSNLFDVEESSHKGLGRLVYLCYFEDIAVTSFFERIKKREFDFTEGFDEEKFELSEIQERPSGTIFRMSNYVLQKIAKSEYLQPKKIKQRILEEFYSRLFQLKNDGVSIKITIEATIEGKKNNTTLESADIPEFTKLELDSKINLIDKFDLYYSIKETDPTESSLIAAISVDNRTVKVDLVAQENMPIGYEMVFLLYSDFFKGKIDAARQNLNISTHELKEVQTLFRKEVVSIIESKIPTIRGRNQKTKKSLVNRYPHLSGYFNTENIGYVSRSEILKEAQKEFFKEQKDLLDATSLTDEQFEKSIEISSRALTEYILFRQFTIDQLKKSTNNSSEAEIHKLFASMRKEGKFEKDNASDDIYRNNAWLLDDKYMTYETVLSDREMGELVKVITDEEEVPDDNRPDIALIFSNNPDNKKPFDVVIVELKKRGISLEENLKVVTQLEKRARKLMKHYNNQIQRIWFYGIIEFNEDVETHLAGEYTELYSCGKMYYRETNVAISLNPKIILPIGVFIWDLDAVIKDADARNSAFLNLIKSKFLNS
ncbi:ATP-binding protein [Sinomicrobium weinanense]|uniref:Sensor histidine kinase n=1 Tax=Sinomicrobium weinanense TaxID=2842200 RepID=A0A926JVH9_9FLAO|nr:ATP-binding protein [Sinomicrobium weinanense]MBC9798245.1 sensor histidine kinase [Sinomicrobium weinanense]MBU3123251.1 ATP-binding protein [Sinomicrobium weinanense]